MRLKSFAGVIAAASFASASLAAAPAFAASHHGAPTGTVTIDAKSANAGVGFSWGDGTLTYKGVAYPFSVKGVDVVAVGYSEVIGHGKVFHLKDLADFDGTYVAGTGEATLGNGVSGQWLTNEKGVEIHIDGVTKGAQLKAAAGGIRLELKK
ncbi:hypothetical protein FHR90_002155 [Endobacter medicaginis]|uniref:DUF1134 domain-containing protein n=1 Tax=Endobacter medicaginis TaxID=1181271 RepID=A0A839V1A3_9PROT|nr:hypothetical protein [Endobacter medicaginis]MBB3174314.1 hypothetical protein [Endobacter medicaginis]MCX5476196.1 hypothetical protein [Endobacter medicaginis]NVN30928.1 hypothetical protein [Endobacter medicaginis]